MTVNEQRAYPAIVRSLSSKDGTRIGYQSIGQGPAMVLIQGTMNTGHNFRDLATALGDDFTVVVPDRRGRGLSGPGASDYDLAREIEDLDAVMTETGAEFVFGLSSGALIALQAGLCLPGLRKVVAYEPPLFRADDLPDLHIARTFRALDRGDREAALVSGMKAGQFGPPWMLALPDGLLKWMVKAQPQSPADGGDGQASMQTLALTLRNDFVLVKALAGSHEAYRHLKRPTLLLGGSETRQPYLRQALHDLASLVPSVARIELPGLDHSGPLNYGSMGRPDPVRVAAEIRRFVLA